MAPKLQQFLDNFFSIQQIVVYVNNKGSNLQTCIVSLNLVVSYDTLGMLKLFLWVLYKPCFIEGFHSIVYSLQISSNEF
jgi:hypothetical protein